MGLPDIPPPDTYVPFTPNYKVEPPSENNPPPPTQQKQDNGNSNCKDYYWGICYKGRTCGLPHEPSYQNLRKKYEFCFGLQNQSGCSIDKECRKVHVTLMEMSYFQASKQLPPEVEKQYNIELIVSKFRSFYDCQRVPNEVPYLKGAEKSRLAAMVQQPTVLSVLSRLEGLLVQRGHWRWIPYVLSWSTRNLLLMFLSVKPVNRGDIAQPPPLPDIVTPEEIIQLEKYLLDVESIINALQPNESQAELLKRYSYRIYRI